jgi:catechol 2,3-dioxygenase-like lactoylglutathione lyase family enzyme
MGTNNDGKDFSAPVSVVTIGVGSLERSLEFYAGTIGLSVIEERDWGGADFSAYWQLPDGAAARTAFLSHGPDPVGRIQLLEFNAGDRKVVRPPDIRRASGLFNLNLYTSDIKADHARLKAQGFDMWGEPAYNNFGPTVGETLEAAFDGPDSVVINMVELLTDDPKTLIGHIKHFVDDYGRTATGFTPVVTTAHSVDDMEKALAFYYGPLQMKLFIESVLEGEETNRALNLPDHYRTRSVLVQGGHEYGKIALAAPMNYEAESIVANAVPPNIGYLVQSFEVPDFAAAEQGCAELGVEIYSPAIDIELPGRGLCRAMLVRNPGSGALQEVFQPL